MKKYIANKCYFVIAIVMIAFCCILTGCEGYNNQSNNYHDELARLSKNSEQETNKADNIGIYVDVTPSMQGFLGLQTDSYKKVVGETRFKICLEVVNAIVASRYNEDSITYYRIDTPLWKTKENVLEQAEDFGYYNPSEFFKRDYEMIDLINEDGEGYESWCLTNALLNCKKDDFSILITDFYENDRAVTRVINALKENMTIGNDGSKIIGIVGIRSEYAGIVYDILPDRAGIEHGMVDGEVTEADIRYRQFYILVMGYPQTVEEFCQRFQESMGIGEDDLKCTVFYENEIYGLDYTDFIQCYTRSNKKGDKLWPDGSVRINDETEYMAYAYANDTDYEKEVYVSYNAERTLLNQEVGSEVKTSLVLPNGQKKEVVEVPYKIDGKMTSYWKEDHYEEEDNLTDFFHVEGIYYSQEEEILYVVFKVSNRKLPSLSLKLNCQVHFDYQNQIEMGWEEQWNLILGQVDCEKTIGLKEYFQALREKMPERNTILLDFAFYLNCEN